MTDRMQQAMERNRAARRPVPFVAICPWGLLLAAGLIVAGGCSNNVAQVSARAIALSEAALKGDTAKVMPLVDPEVVRKQGAGVVGFKMQFLTAIVTGLKGIPKGEVKLDVIEVNFSESTNRATVKIQLYQPTADPEKRTELSTVEQTWVRREGEWYFVPPI